MTDLTLTVTHQMAAPPDRVFAAWLDPAMLARFMVPGPSMTVPQANTDPRVGGRFDLIMRGETDMPHSGTYLAISPHDHLSFTWESPFSVDGSRVDLTFAAQDGGTLVTLTHTKFASPQARDNHAGGWAAILRALGSAVGKQ